MGRNLTRVVLILALVGVLVLSALTAGALTSWKRFGNGTAYGRGTFGSPYVSLMSTTDKHPAQIRFTIENGHAQSREVSYSWFVACWGENYEYGSLSGTGDRLIDGKTEWVRTFIDLPLANPSRCELDVSAYHFEVGKLRVLFEQKLN